MAHIHTVYEIRATDCFGDTGTLNQFFECPEMAEAKRDDLIAKGWISAQVIEMRYLVEGEKFTYLPPDPM